MADQPHTQKALADLGFGDLLESVATKSPAPGGGAVASATGALASALGIMVVNFSFGKKRLTDHQDTLHDAVGRLDRARALLLRLAEEDAAAYEAVSEAMKNRRSDGQANEAMRPALEAAVAAPMNTLAAAVDLLRLLHDLVPVTNRHLHSDLAIAAILAEATARASEWNVRINLPLVRREISENEARSRERQASDLLSRAGDLLDEIEDACRRSADAAS